MTREEFFEEYVTFESLIEFCNEYDLSACEDIITEEEVPNLIRDLLDTDGYIALPRIKDLLEDFYGYGYYSYNGSGLDALGEYDIESYQDMAAREFERNGFVWDGEDEYGDDEDEYGEVYDTKNEEWFDDTCEISEDIDVNALENLIQMI